MAREVDSRLKRLEELAEIEKKIEADMEKFQNELETINENSADATNVNQILKKLNYSSTQLDEILKSTVFLSNKINKKIHELDSARMNVLECQKRVQDLSDLQLCSDGVQEALKNENYEQASVHIHRFLGMDQQLLKRTADEFAQDCTTVTHSLKMLREATDMIRNKILFHFQEAASVNDTKSVQQFFKLFPLLDLREEGLQHISSFLRKILKNSVNEKLHTVKVSNVKERKHLTIFADTTIYLFEEIAKIITEYRPLVETYYGSGTLIKVASLLQKECDQLIEVILQEFKTQRDLNSRIHLINEFLRSGSSKSECIDPKEIDILLLEATMIHSRYNLYITFLHSRIQEDLKSGSINSTEAKKIELEFDNLVSSCELSKKMQSLIGDYLLLERYYMEQSIKKAMQMDVVDKDALVSSMVDDIFFIVKKCIRRAYGSANLDAVCAVINNACAFLETEVCNTLKQQLRQGYSAGYLDLTQAYNVMIQGRLQHVDSEQTRVSFLASLNNCDVCSDHTNTLLLNLHDEIRCSSENETAKLKSCLSGFSSVIEAFSAIREYGLLQLKNSVVKPRVVPWVDSFLHVSHNISSEEFSNYEANEPFVKELIFNLDSLLSEFKRILTSTNYESFVIIVADEVILQFEKDILKSEFNRNGGLILDKEIRTLISFMSNASSWSIREKFSRLIQISLILNFEKITDVMEYMGSDSPSFSWKLTRKEVKNVLLLSNSKLLNQKYWKKYVEELYGEKNINDSEYKNLIDKEEDSDELNKDPENFWSEFEKALRDNKNKKAVFDLEQAS